MNDFTFLPCATTLRAEGIAVSPRKLWVPGSIRQPLSDCISGNFPLTPALESNMGDFSRCLTKLCHRKQGDKNCINSNCCLLHVSYVPTSVPDGLHSFYIIPRRHESGKTHVLGHISDLWKREVSFLFRLQIGPFPYQQDLSLLWQRCLLTQGQADSEYWVGYQGRLLSQNLSVRVL